MPIELGTQVLLAGRVSNDYGNGSIMVALSADGQGVLTDVKNIRIADDSAAIVNVTQEDLEAYAKEQGLVLRFQSDLDAAAQARTGLEGANAEIERLKGELGAATLAKNETATELEELRGYRTSADQQISGLTQERDDAKSELAAANQAIADLRRTATQVPVDPNPAMKEVVDALLGTSQSNLDRLGDAILQKIWVADGRKIEDYPATRADAIAALKPAA